MKEMIIKLLTDTKVWTVVGTLITIGSLYLVIEQHKDDKVVISWFGRSVSDMEINDGDKIYCILMGLNKDKGDSLTYNIPVGLYNSESHMIKVQYLAKSSNRELLSFKDDPSAYVIDRYSSQIQTQAFLTPNSGQLCKIRIRPNIANIDSFGIDTCDISLGWSYENMNEKSKVSFSLLTIDQAYFSKNHRTIISDRVAVYFPENGQFELADVEDIGKMLTGGKIKE